LGVIKMNVYTKSRGLRMAFATATAIAASLVAVSVPMSPATAQTVTQRASTELTLSKGRGQLISLPAAISDVLVSNETVADVQVRSPRQIYVYAKDSGESTIFATTKDGKVVYSANVRVGNNVNSLDQMLQTAMPEAAIKATTMNGLVLLTGTISAPEDGAEAERLVKAFVGKDMEVVSRLRAATPMQVMLKVKIAEVSREFGKEVGFNLLNRDSTGGFLFGLAQGRNFGNINATTNAAGQAAVSYNLNNLGLGAGKTSLAFAGKFLGLDLAGALDLAENDGLVSTLAQPTLTALSGETASFLAGGEIPIPVVQGTANSVSVEYKQYGVSLAFTPTVLSDGRISMRVRPEVSQLTSNGSVTLNGFNIPALLTRRTETTVELGSGQAFMIGGLLNNSSNNSLEKAPVLGDIPILGSLFRSTKFKRNETELMIIVTPYLVKPVSANQIVLPTDGYKKPNDAEALILGETFTGQSGGKRPKPSAGDPVTVAAPSIGMEGPPAPSGKSAKRSRNADAASAAPGFGN
jgi:pilus assembly protein CpaC